jgi:hypothetical protein
MLFADDAAKQFALYAAQRWESELRAGQPLFTSSVAATAGARRTRNGGVAAAGGGAADPDRDPELGDDTSLFFVPSGSNLGPRSAFLRDGAATELMESRLARGPLDSLGRRGSLLGKNAAELAGGDAPARGTAIAGDSGSDSPAEW